MLLAIAVLLTIRKALQWNLWGIGELGNKSLGSLCRLLPDIRQVLYMKESVTVQEDMYCVI